MSVSRMSGKRTIVEFRSDDFIRVQLTDWGREVYRRDYIDRMGDKFERFPFTPVKEDEKGWSEWQLWHYMEIFGPYAGPTTRRVASAEMELVWKKREYLDRDW